MKAISRFLMLLVICACVLCSGEAFAIVVPEEMPYTYNGVTYTSVIAVLNTQNGYTNHLYCSEDVLIDASPGESYFSWRCGLDRQYNHYIIHSYDPEGNNFYDVVQKVWGPIISGGDTYSGFASDTILTSVDIVATDNHNVIVFSRNFSQYVPPIQVSFPIKVPEFVPYIFNGVTYTSIIAVLDTQSWYTNQLYCAEQVLIEADPGESYFSWRCGLSGQNNHYMIRTYDPEGSSIYDVAQEVWGPVVSAGDTYSGFTNDTILTSVDIVDASNHSSIIFARNFSISQLGKLVVTPMQHKFGIVRTDTCSLPAEFKLKNTGIGNLIVFNILLSNQKDFLLDPGGGKNPCNSTNSVLDPGGSCTVAVMFTPSEKGPSAGELVVSSNDPDNASLTIPLSGRGRDNAKLDLIAQTDPKNCGTIALSPPGKTYKYGTKVKLTAKPDKDCVFNFWTDGSSDYFQNPLEVVMDNDKSFTAVFTRTFRCTESNFKKSVGKVGGECVKYVRDETGIRIFGDAYTWFDQAVELGYATGSEPRESAIIVFAIQDGMSHGHVGIVKQKIDETHLIMRDSNWCNPATCHLIKEHNVDISQYNILGYIYCTP